MNSFAAALLASVFLAAVMTLGDFVWAALRLPHRMAYGLAHGAAMCLCLGLVVGIRAGKPATGALAGPIIGVIAAGMFYVLAPWLRYGAMLPAWMLFWMLFALLQQRLRRDETTALALIRGTIAAVLSGVAFYFVSGIWTGASARDPDYLFHFGAWTLAFAPGFLTLFHERGGK
jgi:hypothetical protein